MKKRLLAFILSIGMVFGIVCVPVLAIAEDEIALESVSDETEVAASLADDTEEPYMAISIGDYITLGTYYGEPIVWRCVDIDENGPLMLSEKILCIKAYDAAGEDSVYHTDGWSSTIRKKWGSSCWEDSNLRQWLNSDELSVSWTHCPPTSEKMASGLNGYEDEAGFLTNFTEAELNMIKSITQTVNVNIWESKRAGYSDGGSSDRIASALTTTNLDCKTYYYKNITDSIFVLSAYQYNRIYCNNPQYLVACPTETAISNSEYKNSSLSANEPYYYWTNIPGGNNYACYEHVQSVDANGSIALMAAWHDYVGVRPAFYLNAYAYFHNRPTLSEESAMAFFCFLFNNGKLTVEEIKASAWYQIMTGTYEGTDRLKQEEALVAYAISATQQMAHKATDNVAYLNTSLIEYLERELERQDVSLSDSLKQKASGLALEKLSEIICDTIDAYLPLPVDSLFTASDYMKYAYDAADTSDITGKAKVYADRLVAGIEAYYLVVNNEQSGRYTYFSKYLQSRGSFSSPEHETFKVLMSGNRFIIGDANWLANFINIFTWLTNKESFHRHYDEIDEWAEYIYQLSCSIASKDIETSVTALSDGSVLYSHTENGAVIDSFNESLQGAVMIPETLEYVPVVRIEENAFKNQTGVESVQLGENIREIGVGAFSGCSNLKTVLFTSSLDKLEELSFQDCDSLEEIVFLSSVTGVNDQAFSDVPADTVFVCNCNNIYMIDYCIEHQLNYRIVHSFTEYVSDENSICESYRTYTATCDDCDEKSSYTDYFNLQEHSYGDWIIDRFETPYENGLRHKSCTQCQTQIVEEIPMIDELSFNGASLTLQDDLALNFKASSALFEAVGYTSPYVVFELNGVQTTVKAYRVVGDKYVFDFSNIAPHQMNDTIYATLYAEYNGELYQSETREYSVATYCYNMFGKTDDGTLKTLLVDLLNYGTASQEYMNYRVEELVGESLTEEQRSWGTNEIRSFETMLDTEYETIQNPCVTWKGAGLNLKNSVQMRFKLTAEDVEGMTVHIKTEDFEWIVPSSSFEKTDGGYYVLFDGLNAGQMSEPVYITAYEDQVAVSNTVRYSIESYAYAKQNDSDAQLAKLLQVMMIYGDSARTYSGSIEEKIKEESYDFNVSFDALWGTQS